MKKSKIAKQLFNLIGIDFSYVRPCNSTYFTRENVSWNIYATANQITIWCVNTDISLKLMKNGRKYYLSLFNNDSALACVELTKEVTLDKVLDSLLTKANLFREEILILNKEKPLNKEVWLYKKVAMTSDGKLWSIYSDEPYIIGKTLRGHKDKYFDSGFKGYYGYDNVREAMRFNAFTGCAWFKQVVATVIIACKAHGNYRVVCGNTGKYEYINLTPMHILPIKPTLLESTN